jgi:hypothetical protein
LSSFVIQLCTFILFESSSCNHWIHSGLYMSSLIYQSYNHAFEFFVWNFIHFTIIRIHYCGEGVVTVEFFWMFVFIFLMFL